MNRFLAALAITLLSGAAYAQTGGIKTQAQLNTEIGTTGCSQPTCLYPDNTTGLITPFGLRQGLLDLTATLFAANQVSSAVTLGSWWSDQGAMTPFPIYRMRDRACVDDGCLISSAQGAPTSPLPNTRAGADLNAVGGGWVKVPNLYSLYVLSSQYHGAIAGQTTTSGQNGSAFGSQSGIGVLGMALSNNASVATTAWGGYFEAAKTNTTDNNYAYGVEIDVDNAFNSVHPLTIYGTNVAITIAAQLDCGGLAPGTTTYNCSAGLLFITNPAVGTPEFDRGIVFGNNSVATQGNGFIQAINFPISYSMIWWRNNSSADQMSAYINAVDSTVNDAVQFITFGPIASTIEFSVNPIMLGGLGGFDLNGNVVNDINYGNAAGFSRIRYDGTSASPTALLSGDVVGNDGFSGYNGSALVSGGRIFGVATENWGANHGMSFEIDTTATGTATRAQAERIMAGIFVGTSTTPTDRGSGNLEAATGFWANGSQGVACSGSPTASFASVGGVVTHC